MDKENKINLDKENKINLDKEKQIEYKESWIKLKIRAEINQMKNRKLREKISEPINILSKVNTVSKPLASLRGKR